MINNNFIKRLTTTVFSLAIFATFLFTQHVAGEEWPLAREIEAYVAPYLMPESHPLKKHLDHLFKTSAALTSTKSLRQSGFFHTKKRKSGMIAAKHHFLRGYVYKLFLHDTAAGEWLDFSKRIEGANLIRNSIAEHNYGDVLKVPMKWIYRLPEDVNLQTYGLYPSRFILVVEDMDIVNDVDNRWQYKHTVTERHLEALYTILTENQLIDSVYIDNIPFGMDGKIAFIDTEHYLTNIKELELTRLMPAFTKKMRTKWRELIFGF